MSFEIRLLSALHESLLLNAEPGVFDHPPGEDRTREFLGDERHHLIAALDGERTIGFVSALHYVHPDKESELWIDEIGVAASFRRQGIGRRLLEAILTHGRTLGCRQAWVLTEPDNAAAAALYRSAGGAAASQLLFEFPLTADGEPDAGRWQRASGTFRIKMQPLSEPTVVSGATLGRSSIEKDYEGDLEGTARGEMQSALTAVRGSAGYVALEHFSGSLAGRRGSFVLQHHGLMERGIPSLRVTVVPDSGTEELTGLTGRLNIRVVGGDHLYVLEYALPLADSPA